MNRLRVLVVAMMAAVFTLMGSGSAQAAYVTVHVNHSSGSYVDVRTYAPSNGTYYYHRTFQGQTWGGPYAIPRHFRLNAGWCAYYGRPGRGTQGTACGPRASVGGYSIIPVPYSIWLKTFWRP